MVTQNATFDGGCKKVGFGLVRDTTLAQKD